MPMIDLPNRSTVEMSTTACSLNVRLEIRSDFDKVIAFLTAARELFAEEAAPAGQTVDERRVMWEAIADSAVLYVKPAWAGNADCDAVIRTLADKVIPDAPTLATDPMALRAIAQREFDGIAAELIAKPLEPPPVEAEFRDLGRGDDQF